MLYLLLNLMQQKKLWLCTSLSPTLTRKIRQFSYGRVVKIIRCHREHFRILTLNFVRDPFYATFLKDCKVPMKKKWQRLSLKSLSFWMSWRDKFVAKALIITAKISWIRLDQCHLEQRARLKFYFVI